MKTIEVREVISETFAKYQLSLVDIRLLEKKLVLDEVTDIASYIRECEAETVNFKVAGEHRQNDWETGWGGDGVYYSDDEYNNLPYYFKNNTHIRVGRKVYRDCAGFAEVDLLRALQQVVFKEQLPKIGTQTVFEYGCGTGSNIAFLQSIMPGLQFYGSDWVNSACNKLITNKILHEDKVRLVNYFDRGTFSGSPVPYVAFTNASLEQSGDRYTNFMDYLISNKLCLGGIHIEPIRELLDIDNPLNLQSYQYAEKRGYLTKFYQYMKSKSVDILLAKDFAIGSKYINGYQVICWMKHK